MYEYSVYMYVTTALYPEISLLWEEKTKTLKISTLDKMCEWSLVIRTLQRLVEVVARWGTRRAYERQIASLMHHP